MNAQKKTLESHSAAIESLDYEELQAVLNSRRGACDIDFLSLVWTFEHKGTSIVLDFKAIYLLISSSKHLSQSKDEIMCALKFYWIEQTKLCKSPYSYKATYYLCCLLAQFLDSYKAVQLTTENLDIFLEYYLTHSWKDNGPVKLLKFKSYGRFRAGVDFNKLINNKLSRSPSGLIHPEVRAKNIARAIEGVLDKLSGGELSYRDWSSGSSFNFLTLDHGKYYIEHCSNFFNQHYSLALALYETLQDSEELVSAAGWPINKDTKAYLSYCLLNEASEEIAKKRNINLSKVQYLKEIVIERFQNNYLANQSNIVLQSPRAKEVFFNKLAIQDLTVSQKERLEYILEYKAWGHEQYKVSQWLEQMDNPSITYDKFFNAYISTLSEIDTDTDKISFKLNLASNLPTVEFYQSIGLSEPRGSGDGYIIQFYKKVLAAGLTDVASSLGWRESELGFPYNAIKIEDNLDFLDQEVFPQRFSVYWIVPKTNGETKLEREITYSTFKKIRQLKSFTRSDSVSPCLYLTDPNNKNVFNSAVPVQRAVPAMWEHFVQQYPPFIALKKISILNGLKNKLAQTETLSHEEHKQLLLLEKVYKENNWESFESDFHLRNTFERVIKELPVIEFFLAKNDTKRKKNWLVRYRDRDLEQDLLNLLDENLSEETKDYIKGIEDTPNAVITKQVSSELVNDCIYPTPHALRHMWAEAVYRRFDGDVGWMIRSQFKHISPSMWLAYVKDKSNAAMHDHVQLSVINSIVSSFIAKRGAGYSGKIASYLRRIMRMTKMVSKSNAPEQLSAIITNEFVSIKSNPWGYCILKRRNQKNARCAENGKPVRDNASPKLCLGCMNNLTEETNIDFIYMMIMNDIGVLNGSDIPSGYKKESFSNVKNAFAQIKKLNPSHHILSLLEEILSNGVHAYV